MADLDVEIEEKSQESLEVNLDTSNDKDKGKEDVPQDIKKRYLDAGASQAFVDSKRFKEIYWEKSEAKREVASKDAELQETKKMMAEFKRHNESLVKAIKSSVKEIAADRNVKDEKAIMEDALGKLDSNISEMMKDKAQALKDQDWERVVLIDDQLYDAKEKKKELKNYVPKEVKDEDNDNTPLEFKRFLKNAPWYNTNSAMRGSAKELDIELLEDPEWQDAPVKDRLEEVRQRIEKLFKFKSKNGDIDDEKGEPNPKKRTPEGLDGGGGTKGAQSKSIKLTSQQVELAKNFGMSPQEYAEQLYIINGGKQ